MSSVPSPRTGSPGRPYVCLHHIIPSTEEDKTQASDVHGKKNTAQHESYFQIRVASLDLICIHRERWRRHPHLSDRDAKMNQCEQCRKTEDHIKDAHILIHFMSCVQCRESVRRHRNNGGDETDHAHGAGESDHDEYDVGPFREDGKRRQEGHREYAKAHNQGGICKRRILLQH